MSGKLKICDFIPDVIWDFWVKRAGNKFEVCADSVGKPIEWIIFYENGIPGRFHPSGYKLARHDIATKQTAYIWENDMKNLLSEEEMIEKIKENDK